MSTTTTTTTTTRRRTQSAHRPAGFAAGKKALSVRWRARRGYAMAVAASTTWYRTLLWWAGTEYWICPCMVSLGRRYYILYVTIHYQIVLASRWLLPPCKLGDFHVRSNAIQSNTMGGGVAHARFAARPFHTGKYIMGQFPITKQHESACSWPRLEVWASLFVSVSFSAVVSPIRANEPASMCLALFYV